MLLLCFLFLIWLIILLCIVEMDIIRDMELGVIVNWFSHELSSLLKVVSSSRWRSPSITILILSFVVRYTGLQLGFN